MKQQEALYEAFQAQRPIIQEFYNIQHHIFSIRQALENVTDLLPLHLEVKLVKAMIREMFLNDKMTRLEMTGDPNEIDWALKTLANFQESMLKAEIQIRTLLDNEKFLTLPQLAGTDKASTVAIGRARKVKIPMANAQNPNQKRSIEQDPLPLTLKEENALFEEILEFEGNTISDDVTAKQLYLIAAGYEVEKRNTKFVKDVIGAYTPKPPQPLSRKPKL